MQCGNIEGCWSQEDVNIGWYGYITSVATQIRTGWGGGNVKANIAAGKRVGLQSVRNPSGGRSPAPRGAKGGWFWVYMVDGGHTGWIPGLALKPAPHPGAWATGPAGLDMHVGRSGSGYSGPGATGCGGQKLNGAVRTVGDSDAYLRYAPHSTAFYYLHAGDKVREFYRSPLRYRCVEVVSGKWCPRGTRGWVLEKAIA